MFFQPIKTPGIAHVAYVIGDAGVAAVVDPRRDIDAYLRVAQQQNLSIAYVIETHRQEDFVLGSAELARVTGAKVVNGPHALFGRGDLRLQDGEELTFAGLRFKALHTPGHTPESLCYALFIADAPDHAWAVFTGDTLFIGETGRTDLSDPQQTAENAGLLYDGVHEKLLPLGAQTLIFPAHGAGSVCGGSIANRDHSSLGLERRYNPVFTLSRDAFIEAKFNERIPRPPYFSVMEQLNLQGGLALAKRPSEISVLQPKQLARELGQAVVLDTRDAEAFAGGHIPESYSVWASGLPMFAGWIAGPSSPVVLVLSKPNELEDAVLSLARIGVDEIQGVLAGGFPAWRDAGLPVAHSGTITPRELWSNLDQVRVLDVREDSELEAQGHIPGASHLYAGHVEQHLSELEPVLDKSQHIAVTCSVGHRASLAVSVLERHGFTHVDNLLGGMAAWSQLGLPKEHGSTRSRATPPVEGQRR